jgi:hypothetical protein
LRCRRRTRINLPPGHDLAPTIEHVQPKSKGGTGELGNLSCVMAAAPG